MAVSDLGMSKAVLFLLLLLSGDVESNPGPPKKGVTSNTFHIDTTQTG